MTISVLVPTYRRPQDLRRCVAALAVQKRPLDQLVIVLRAEDQETRDALPELAVLVPKMVSVFVPEPGVVAALNTGLAAVTTDVVAITDDDAAPHPDWLDRLVRGFAADPALAGIGGRDVIGGTDDPALPRREIVGQVQWFGRVIGNHHIGCGGPRKVHVLKGVNSAYRTELLRCVGFDRQLKGRGAQVHFELALGLALIAQGKSLLYDPSLLVDHYPAVRHDYDQRKTFNPRALSDEVHNETLVLLRHFPLLRRLAFLFWALLCGTRAYPGLVCWIVETARGRPGMTMRLAATFKGRLEGLASYLSAGVAPRAP